MKDKIMLLNGMRIEFNGVNRHEFDCHRGRCVTEEDMLWDIKFMKQHNINAVRTCHYPDQSRWYELCDEYGIYMIGETNMETHGTWTLFDKDPVETCIPGDKPEWRENVLDRVNSMVQRDKNHPAILLWSCGNESFGGSNIFKMSEFMRKLDNSRLVHYEGITQDRRYPDTSDVESWMYGRPWDVEEYLQNQPGSRLLTVNICMQWEIPAAESRITPICWTSIRCIRVPLSGIIWIRHFTGRKKMAVRDCATEEILMKFRMMEISAGMVLCSQIEQYLRKLRK